MKNLFALLTITLFMFSCSKEIENQIIPDSDYKYAKQVQLFDQDGKGSVLLEIAANQEDLLMQFIENPDELVFLNDIPSVSSEYTNSAIQDDDLNLDNSAAIQISILEVDMPSNAVTFALRSTSTNENTNKTSIYGTGFKVYLSPYNNVQVTGAEIKGKVFSKVINGWAQRGHFDFPGQWSMNFSFLPTPQLKVRVVPTGTGNWHDVNFY